MSTSHVPGKGTVVITGTSRGIGYHLAHYLFFLLLAGQLIVPLASDPFGWGWDLFGTVNYRLRVEVLDVRLIWFAAVGGIVLGHIFAVYLAHETALRILNNARMAGRSQFPMMVLMIGYTVLSLWILSQPIVK